MSLFSSLFASEVPSAKKIERRCQPGQCNSCMTRLVCVEVVRLECAELSAAVSAYAKHNGVSVVVVGGGDVGGGNGGVRCV